MLRFTAWTKIILFLWRLAEISRTKRDITEVEINCAWLFAATIQENSASKQSQPFMLVKIIKLETYFRKMISQALSFYKVKYGVHMRK